MSQEAPRVSAEKRHRLFQNSMHTNTHNQTHAKSCEVSLNQQGHNLKHGEITPKDKNTSTFTNKMSFSSRVQILLQACVLWRLLLSWKRKVWSINSFHQAAVDSEVSPSLPLSLSHAYTHKKLITTFFSFFFYKSLLIDLSLLSGDSPQHINQRNWNSWLHHFTPHPGLRDCVQRAQKMWQKNSEML